MVGRMFRYGRPCHSLVQSTSHRTPVRLLRRSPAALQARTQDTRLLAGGVLSAGCPARILRVSASRIVLSGLPERCCRQQLTVSSHSCRGLASGPSPGPLSVAPNLAARLVEAAPAKMQPYLKLVRLDKPVGKLSKTCYFTVQCINFVQTFWCPPPPPLQSTESTLVCYLFTL